MSKYGVAKELIEAAHEKAAATGIDTEDVMEATLVLLVQELKPLRGVASLRSFLQYEIDSLGSGGVYEIQRGGGHS